MGNTDPETNPLYARAEDLHPSHWERLGRRPPAEASQAAGAEWDGESFSLPLLGHRLRVFPARRTVAWQEEAERPVGYQRALVAVAYLAGAVDAPVRGDWVAFRELPGGEAFFRGPHSLATPQLEQAFGARPGELVRAAEALGGAPAPGADKAADIPALPRIPLRALLWAADPEFPASAALLVDARAHLHVALDVLWALSNLAVADLVRHRR
ncbi:MAG: DUF3786 domain-containing protein [Deferrisomatales bacterium]